MRAYRLYEEGPNGERTPIEHPLVVDRVPGEEGYSPYLHLHWVRVPAGWNGRLRSFEEVENAVASGLASEPEPENRYVHCPIAAPDAQIDVGGDAIVVPEPRSGYAAWKRAASTSHKAGMRGRSSPTAG